MRILPPKPAPPDEASPHPFAWPSAGSRAGERYLLEGAVGLRAGDCDQDSLRLDSHFILAENPFEAEASRSLDSSH